MRTIPDPRNPAVVKWLDGIQPAWTMLDWDSFLALHFPPSPDHGPIGLADNLTHDELQQSAIARNALILLREAGTGPGLKMTATGNLSRAVVAKMIDCTEWPGFDNELHFKYLKVINEAEFYPLFFLRHVLQEARLVRRYKGHLKATRLGHKAMEQPGLLALLFFTAFWRLDLGYFSHGLHDDWPQRDIGSILWSLSVAAHEWQTSERLTRLCAVPINELFERPWDTGSHAMEGQIFRPLRWFGLLEARDAEKQPEAHVPRRLWRKTALFDRFLSFDIQLSTGDVPHH
jgi:hypothetical protein